MSRLFTRLLDRYRLVLPIALLLALSGLLAWFTMPRQEDPSMPDRFGIVIAAYPGADAETVERLITDPIEEHLAQVAQVFEVASTSRTDVAVLRVRLGDAVYDTREAWDEVEDALEDARAELPEGAQAPELEHELITDQHVVVLAVTGSLDRRALLSGAKRVKRALLRVPGVSEVSIEGDPGEQVIVELDDARARRLGLAPGALARALAANNSSLPAGVLAVDGRNTSIKAKAELQSVADLERTDVTLPSGVTVPLREIARVRIGPEEPTPTRMRYAGAEAVGVAVVPKPGIDVVALGERVRAELSTVSETLAPLEVHELSFQPDYVSSRLSGLGRSLLLGIAIVAGILILAMGARLGLLVASVVPLVALAALAVYAMGGGVLHQISVAALIIALGMLVDNAIVVAESIQQKLDAGQPATQATSGAVRELAVPLFTATGTTLAAFVPMYLSKGGTGDFTRAIPIVIMLTLVISYLYAVLVTPSLACLFLRPRTAGGGDRLAGIVGWAGRVATRRPWHILAGALLAVGLAAAGASQVGQSFFPASGRNQLVVEVVHPEGTHIDETDETARALERHLAEDARVRAVSSFVGRSAPRFYYNLPNRPRSPHFAHVVIETHRAEDVPSLAADLGAWGRRALPAAEIVPRPLEQGPPVTAPVEVRLHGEDLADLFAAAERVMASLRRIEGVRNVTHDLGLGVPSVELEVHDAAAARRGLSREDVATALLAQTRGLPVGALRSEEDPIPIVVRAPAGERTSPAQLPALSVPSARGGLAAAHLTPLAQVARTDVRWRPAAIHRRDRVREVAVTAHLADGQAFGPVLAELRAGLDDGALPKGVSMSFGGAAQGSGEANAAIVTTAPIGAILLLLFLMLEFDSFRRVGLILLTVPLAATGVVPGLLVADQPFGFMSLLGVIALVGVVVNNAIVLLDVIEARRAEGLSVPDAVAASVALRARPILLTTATTVAGLTPLAISPSPLWPPLASAMIAGLIASTALTLLVVPAAYTLLFRPRSKPPGRAPKVAAAAGAAGLALLLAGPALAAPSLSEVLARGAEQPLTEADRQQLRQAEARADAEWRQAFLPTLGAEAGVSRIDRQLSLVTPAGNVPFGAQSAGRVGVGLTQPLLDLARLAGTGPAASAEAEAARLALGRTLQVQAATAGARFFDDRAVAAELAATRAYTESIEARAKRLDALVKQGRALEADLLRVELALADARQQTFALEARRRVARRALAEAIGAAEPVAAGEVDLPLDVPRMQDALPSALERRSDLRALARSAEAAGERQRSVWLELVPKLEARGQFVYDSGLPYDTHHYFTGSLNVVWNPIAAGTRLARDDAEEAEQARTRARLEAARRGVRIEVEAAYAALETTQRALEVAKSAVLQAEETVRVERLRYEEGQVTVSDLLETEALLLSQASRRAVAEVEVDRARLLARLALGGPLFAEADVAP